MADDNQKPYTYGDGLAKAYGVPRELILSTQAHILASLAGPKPQLSVLDIPMPFRSGGFVIAGAQARIGSLVDLLLGPIHEYQRERMHARAPLNDLSDATIITKGVADNYAGNVRLDELLGSAPTRANLVKTLGGRNRNRYAATHPLLLIEGVEPSGVLSRATESKDASPIWFDRGCLLGQANAKSMGTLQPWLRGHQSKSGKDSESRYSRLGYLATLEVDTLSSLANDHSDTLRAIQDTSNMILLLEGSVEDGEKDSLQKVNIELRDELLAWKGAVGQAILLRDYEDTLTAYGIKCSAEELYSYRLESMDLFIKDSSILDTQILNDLLSKVLFAVVLLESSGAKFGAGPLYVAGLISQYLYTEQLSAEQWIEDQANQSSLDRDKACLIRALERKGPCTWSQLRRSLNKQGREDNEASINALIAEGRLSLDNDGVFHLKTDEQAA